MFLHILYSCSIYYLGTAPNPKKRDGRKPTIGKGLDNWTRASGAKMTISVVEGKKRPEQLLQAAKLASECGIAVRNYVPIFQHWKEYKKEENKEVVTNYMDKVAVSPMIFQFFDIHILALFIVS